MKKIGASFIGQFYKMTTKKDSSGRMEIDFGADAIDEIQWIQRVAAKRMISFQIAFIPLPPEHIGQRVEDDLDSGQDGDTHGTDT